MASMSILMSPAICACRPGSMQAGDRAQALEHNGNTNSHPGCRAFRSGGPQASADPTQKFKQFAMHDFVAAADRACLKIVRLAVGAGDEAAGLADQKLPSRNVPGIEAALPKSVETAGGDVGEIERGATHPADVDDLTHHRAKLGQKARMLRHLAEMGDAAAEDRLRQLAAPGHPQPAIAAKC